MLQDESANPFWIIGYDLRVWPLAEIKNSSVHVSLDANVWPSARELSNDLICDAYSVERIGDVSNGLNLAISPPPKSAPPGFVRVAFDAPKDIINQIWESFGMQHSLGDLSNSLLTAGFVFVGYDVVDIWTQRTALYPSEVFQAILNTNRSEFNEWGLFPTQAAATHGCLLADASNPGSSPFQPVGVWIHE